MVLLISLSHVENAKIKIVFEWLWKCVSGWQFFLKCSHVRCHLELGKRCFLIDYPNCVCISVAMDMSNKSYLLVWIYCLSSCVFMKLFFNMKKDVVFN